MKNGKRPTLNQKRSIELLKLNPNNWLVVKDCTECFVIVNRNSGKMKRFEGRKKNV